jgi:hypothetical protein
MRVLLSNTLLAWAGWDLQPFGEPASLLVQLNVHMEEGKIATAQARLKEVNQWKRVLPGVTLC